MSTLLGQGARYAVAGGAVALVYVLTTLALHHAGGLHFQLALALGLVVAVTTHFVAQRAFVWRHERDYALTVGGQAGRYLAVTLVQYALTTLSTAVLPQVLGLATDVVYVATVACLTALTFVLLRTRVFHPAGSPT
jgi:putative flippase GtrA